MSASAPSAPAPVRYTGKLHAEPVPLLASPVDVYYNPLVSGTSAPDHSKCTGLDSNCPSCAYNIRGYMMEAKLANKVPSISDYRKSYYGFKPSTIAACLRRAQRLPDGKVRRVVSVGSGGGELEHLLTELGVRELTCVDPKPGSWPGSGVKASVGEDMAPAFASVTDLLKARPEDKGACVLFLGWPFPNESCYDMEAVQLLEPTSVVSVMSMDGAAGGRELLNWIATQLPTSDVLMKAMISKLAVVKHVTPSYKMLFFRTFTPKTTCPRTDLVWLARGQLARGWREDKHLLEESTGNGGFLKKTK